METEKEYALTGRGVALVTFLTDPKEADRVMYYKNLFLQMAERHGMTVAKFEEYAGETLPPVMSYHAAVLQYLETDGDRIAKFVQWIFNEQYLTDTDVMGAFGAKVAEPPKQSKNFKPAGKLDELKAKQPVWIEIKSAPNNNGFNVTLSMYGQEFTYPETMELEEACSCVAWFVEEHRLPWGEAVFIPVNEIIKQSDRSLTCRRVLKEMQSEGLLV
ncbi:hypothetical protein [Sporomusa acidovorans]|uniref:Uncharacterized protein n=1 Tax=Sporomusa acidovorans (strain ATCC 49682 / DSM 3132 / Mol) TaxID=1123286 RepID=A0ABZ3IZE8_SPOA4|nr:hypothetical protein [Sporomusa acidovorans]OZC22080.1 hypothetical protein SPACI_15980 [Sporomusa acidovorans DSM 3132]SDF65930.1 hypothetical protein SAMN04488499_10665 [Sporomusa acidovorans]